MYQPSGDDYLVYGRASATNAGRGVAAGFEDKEQPMAIPDGHVPVPGSEREPLEGARATGAVPGDEHVEVTVLVRYHAGSKPLASTAKFGVPAPAERSYLTREQLEAASGADPADIQAVEDFAAAHGLTVLDSDPARRSVSLAGTAAQMSAAFGVELERYEHAEGSYRGRTGAVHIPKELEGIVDAVLGLDDRPAASPRLRIGMAVGDRAADPRAVAGSFTPVQLADLYDFPDGADGTGQCIAIIELGGGYKTADLKAYFKSLNLKMPKVTAIGVDGGKNAPTGDPNSADGEVALDIEVAGGVAPGAQLAVYFAPNTDRGFLDAITTALHDKKRKPSVISISWGGAEANWTAQSLKQFDAAFASAAALGVTILCAAGDDGSNDSMTDGKAHADFPSSSPHVTACGGTRLDVTNGAIHDEIVWNNPGHGSTGGGISDAFPVPSWQTGKVPKSANPGHRAGRGIPDLAADADPATGYKVIVDGSNGVFGGTSAVAPLIAGLIARINQTQGQSAGFLNPILYNKSSSSKAFRDITSGNNGAYHATKGWDACSGWGRPIGTRLQDALSASAALNQEAQTA
jgi:kumamolisin